jgi:hypothetical protein
VSVPDRPLVQVRVKITPPAGSDVLVVVIVPLFVCPGLTVPILTVPPVTVSRTVTSIALLAPDGSVLEKFAVITALPEESQDDDAD